VDAAEIPRAPFPGIAVAKKRIGIYGGSFDPLHYGHLNLAIEIKEHHDLDEVWLCPATISPHKIDNPPVAANHRCAMLRHAIEDISFCSILDIELTRQGPSYTIDTIKWVMSEYPSSEYNFFLLLGEDILPSFERWHNIEELVEAIPLLIGSWDIAKVFKDFSLPSMAMPVSQGLTPIRHIKISSTLVRSRLCQGLYCGHLVPEKVLDYIYKNGLYT
jgi:nicotinate-nucleotide adenylyltransferase